MNRSARAGRRSRTIAVLAVLGLATLLIAPAMSGQAAAATDGFLRLGHFALGTGPVDEYVDGVVMARSVAYTQVTPYSQVAGGPHSVALRPAGSAPTAATIWELVATVRPGISATVAVVAGPTGLAATVYSDDLSAPPAGKAKIRIIHAVAAVQAVNVYVSPGPTPTALTPTAIVASPTAIDLPSTPAFSGLQFGAASPYADLSPGDYEVDLQAMSTGQVILAAHSWPVTADSIASVVVLQGSQGVTLEVVRDAAGTLATPTGAMATGEGGTSHSAALGLPGGLPLAAATLVALVAIAASAVLRRRDHRVAVVSDQDATSGS